MKVSRAEIQLSPAHPSLLLNLEPVAVPSAPLILDPRGVLVDGYRRFQMDLSEGVEVFRIDSCDLFERARAFNLHTRIWDDIECFLWKRWAVAIGSDFSTLPVTRFPSELQTAEPELLRLLAARRLTLRQAALILRAPITYRPFFVRMFSAAIQLNNNESGDFIEICCDLKQRLKTARIEDVLPANFQSDDSADLRRKGQRLLKELRILRYPRHTQKMIDFEEGWNAMNLGAIQVAKKEFVERGKLEITISATNHSELREKVRKLSETLDSPEWTKIWD